MRAAAVTAACAAVAVALLAVPATLAYDPWAWLVWGREVVGLELDTTGGPSWKPGPVVAAAALTPLGGLAPTAWLVLARTLALVGLVGVFRLARQLSASVATGIGAGLAAVVLLVLTPDAGPRFVRMVLEGHSAPVTAGLAAWTIERHLAGRPRAALWLLVALSLDRPEAWPFLGGYAVWARRQRQVAPIELAAALAAVPLLWFGGDWWGSGSPLHGADAAQDVPGEYQLVDGALRRAFESVVAPVWVASLAGAGAWARQRRRGLDASPALVGVAALTALGVAWCAVVVAMNALLGFAALSRFFLPGDALLCVAAAVAVAEAVRVVAPSWRPVLAAAMLAVALPAAVGRTSNLRATLDEAADRARADDALAERIAEEGGAAAVRACRPLSIDTADVPRPALAWRADVPLGEVRRTPDPPAGTMVLRTDGDAGWVVRRGPCR